MRRVEFHKDDWVSKCKLAEIAEHQQRFRAIKAEERVGELLREKRKHRGDCFWIGTVALWIGYIVAWIGYIAGRWM